MNIPTIPTDGLYKFMALSGLLISIALYVAPMIVLHKIGIDSIKLEEKTKLLLNDIGFAQSDFEELQLLLDRSNTANGLEVLE